MKSRLLKILSTGLEQMGIVLNTHAQEQLLSYVMLLVKWSRVYNLTTVRDPKQIITVHILDSLTVLPFLEGASSVLDVGTGAGLPGIPLAIARPDIAFTLLDSQQKKINFVQHVITSLQLTNAAAVQQRVESLSVNSPIDVVVSRAFASLDEFVNLIVNICNKQTKILAMKGKTELVLQEAQALPAGFELLNIETVTVPGLDAERCLVFLQRKEHK